jgi:hypothetical protein
MDKKAEWSYLNEFIGNFLNFPNGEICPSESPDFLIKCQNEVVGIELTNFFRAKADTGETSLQQRQAVRYKIMKYAKVISDQRGLLGAHVFVHFDLGFCCKTSEISETAYKLVQVVEQVDRDKEKFIRRNEIEIAGVDGLSVTRTKGKTSYWRDPLASFVPTVDPQQIQDILDQKSARCTDYRKKCDKIWLLIIMDRFNAAQYSLITDEVTDYCYMHDFDSAFFFCRDYYDKQKPPYLLRTLLDISKSFI